MEGPAVFAGGGDDDVVDDDEPLASPPSAAERETLSGPQRWYRTGTQAVARHTWDPSRIGPASRRPRRAL
jgi:hypothetical protein